MRVPVSWLTDHLDLDTGADTGADADRLVEALLRIGIEVEGQHPLADVTGPLVVGEVTEITELTGHAKPVRYCTVDVASVAANTTSVNGSATDASATDGSATDGSATDASSEDASATDDDADEQHAEAGNDHGQPTSRGIVAGATNFAVGDLVPVALPGTVLPGGFAIAARKAYGHLSEGMMCSASELGLGQDHTGILVLEPGSAMPGEDARPVLGLDDVVLEVEPTPDFGHALSIRGLARELACALDVPFGDPAARELPEEAADAWPVRIDDTAGCSRFVIRRVRDLDPHARSPWWMRRRLLLSGIRPISLAVDVTNYVMLELGQPLHAFDTARVSGGLVIRRANDGEPLTTLDEAERSLHSEDIVIADDSGVISLAGTMGGAGTEIDTSSADVLIEAAHWDPASISRTARRHRLFSEAAKRFERHTDPALPAVAAERAAQLLHRYGGGVLEAGRTDEGAVPSMPAVAMPIAAPDRTAGVQYARGVTVRRLTQIGCGTTIDTGDDGTAWVTAEPPSWRADLTQAADLVEEVLRLEGYDTIPSVLPAAPAGRGLTEPQRVHRAVSRALAESGFVEVVPFPFVGAADWDLLGLGADDRRRDAVPVLNPLESDRDGLTTTLLVGLVEHAQRNIARGFRDLALYHIGQVTAPVDGAVSAPDPSAVQRPSDAEVAALEHAVPDQPLHVAAVLTGLRQRRGWWGGGEEALWSDAIEAARLVGTAAGVELEVRTGNLMPWHPGRCAELFAGAASVGHAGELHPAVVEAAGLPSRAVAMELNLDAVPVRHHRPAPVVSPYPPVLLDVALVVPDHAPAAEVAAAVRDGAGALLEDLGLFDVYSGEQIGEGYRSLAFTLRFRAPDRTLTVAEATGARDAAVATAYERHGATLRG